MRQSLVFPDPERVVHHTITEQCIMVAPGVYTSWKTRCGLDLNRASLDVRIDDRWPDVNCKRCLRRKPKR